MFSVVRLLLENSQNSAVKGLGRDSYVTKSHSNVWVLRSQMGLSQDQLLFAFFFLLWRHWNGQEEHCTFGLGIVLDLNTDLRRYALVGSRTGKYPNVWALDEDIKYRVQTGSVEGWQEERPWSFTAPALRGSFEMEKAERTRRERGEEERGGVEPTAWEMNTGSLREFQSGRHSGWWVIYSTERLVGWKTLF